MLITDKPIIVEEIFKSSIHQVWDAITQHELMIQWFFTNIPAFEPKVGFETQFLVENEGRRFTHLWKIVDVKDNRRIHYDWSYAEYPGRGRVLFELFDVDDKVKLVLTMHVLESFPQDIPEFTRGSCLAGWNYFIGERLKQFLSLS